VNVYNLADFAHGKGVVEAEAIVDVEDDAGALEAFEARVFDGGVVATGVEEGNGVISGR
jgi:hypothetical protein